MQTAPTSRADAIDRYLVLVDISGYTGFLAGVETMHGEDFSGGLPAGYRALGELVQGVIDGLQPEFELVKVEGDAVFGAAAASVLDGHGPTVLERLATLYSAFLEQRDVLARTASDDKCSACFAVATLDLKAVIHRGLAVRQTMGSAGDLIGPAVNVAHRLLKNTVREQIGYRPYLLVTQPAAERLDLADLGVDHREAYADVGPIDTRVADLAVLAGLSEHARSTGIEGLPAITLAPD